MFRRAVRFSDIAVSITGERIFGKHAGGTKRPSHVEIAQLAYYFYETRGRRDGQDVDDWLAAESELARRYR